MSRFQCPRLALPLLSLSLLTAVPCLAQSPPITTTNPAPGVLVAGLPVVQEGAISALLLDGGLLIHRAGGGTPSWFFAYGSHDGQVGRLHVSAFAGGSDAGDAIASLFQFHRFSEADVATLLAFADGADLSDNSGTWTGLSKQEAYNLAADPALGTLGGKLGLALAALDASQRLSETPNSLVASGTGPCAVTQAIGASAIALRAGVTPAASSVLAPTAATQTAATQTGATQTATTQTIPAQASAAYVAKAQLQCAGGWPPPPGTTPAFPPASPGFTPPTGPVTWTGTGCAASQIATTSPCINPAGQLCTCTCTQVGSLGASWKPNPASCGAIPPGPGPGTPGGPGACSPVGGTGPCTNASGATCACPCVAGGGGGGVWGTPSCSSGSASLALIFALLAAIAVYRQRT